jgi:ADP-ribosylation factor 6
LTYSDLKKPMGSSLSRIFQKFFGNKEVRILMLGLDAAGKTSK